MCPRVEREQQQGKKGRTLLKKEKIFLGKKRTLRQEGLID